MEIHCEFNDAYMYILLTYAQYILVILFVISVISRAAGDLSLVCSSDNLLVDLSEPTSFCQIQGQLHTSYIL